MSLYTTTDPEYMAKSRYPSSQAYYDAEDARAEWEEMVATNARLIKEVNESDDANEFLMDQLAKLQQENERLTLKCEKLEEYSAEQFNRAVSLQHDLDLMDKYEDEEALFDSDCWEAYN